MTTYAESFKREVARVSKKEVRGEITPLRKATTTHRSEIAALKKTVKSLEATVRQLVKLANRTGATAAAPAAPDRTALESAVDERTRDLVEARLNRRHDRDCRGGGASGQ